MSQQRIVVGVSGSAASGAALRWAAAESLIRGARVQVVHAWESSAGFRAPYAPPSGRPSREDEQRAATKLAERAVAEIPDLAEAGVITAVIEGPVVQVLLRSVETADLLVLGVHEADAEPNPMISPVVAACLLRARCPVVVVSSAMTHTGARAGVLSMA